EATALGGGVAGLPRLPAALGIGPGKDTHSTVAAGARAEAARQAERVIGAALRLGRQRAGAVTLSVGAGVGAAGQPTDAAGHLVPGVGRADADADVAAGGRAAMDLVR